MLQRVGKVNLSIVLGLTCSASFVQADDQSKTRSAAVIEEVVVTARRRAENLQEIPVAVSAVSANEMSLNNIDNISGLTRIVPGLERHEGRKQASFSIRGIGRSRTAELSLDPSVGVYVDGIFLPRNDSQLVDAVAIENVQVLRGPQGTLFGKNTIGGAILVTTKRPADHFQIELDTRLDTFNGRDWAVSMDVPMLDSRVLTRFTLAQKRGDGFAEDEHTGRHFGTDDRVLFVAQSFFDISEDFNVTLLGFFNDQEEMIPPYNCQFATREGVLSAVRTPGREESYEDACRRVEPLFERKKVSSENVGSSYNSEDYLFSARALWGFESGDLTSLTSFSGKKPSVLNFEVDATDLLYVINRDYFLDELIRQGLFSDEDDVGSRWGWSQEFQFAGRAINDRLNYTVGLFASKESIDRDLDGQRLTREGWLGFERLDGLGDAPAGSLYVVGSVQGGVASYDNLSYAAFGQVAFDISNSVQIALGVRHSIEERELKSQDFAPVSNTPPVVGGLPAVPGAPLLVMTEAQFNSLEGISQQIVFGRTDRGKTAFESTSPMLSLSWQLTDAYDIAGVDSLMVYATVAEGFKSGGFAPRTDFLDTYDPEVVVSTEVGFKLDALNNRLRYNLAFYRSEFTDMQVLVARVDGLGGIDTGTDNAAESLISGAELELTYLLNNNYTLTLSGAYTDADIQSFNDFRITSQVDTTPIPIDRSGEPLPFIPEVSYSVSIRGYWETEAYGDFNLVASAGYRSEIFIGQDFKAGLPEFRSKATTDSYSVANLRFTWLPLHGDSLALSLFGKNILDETYVAWGLAVYDGIGSNAVIRGEPAQWGMELNYRFTNL